MCRQSSRPSLGGEAGGRSLGFILASSIAFEQELAVPDGWSAALIRLFTRVRANCWANSAGMRRRQATVPRNSGALLPLKRSLAWGRTVVKAICIMPPMFMMLKGPLMNSSGTLLGSEISIGPWATTCSGICRPAPSPWQSATGAGISIGLSACLPRLLSAVATTLRSGGGRMPSPQQEN